MPTEQRKPRPRRNRSWSPGATAAGAAQAPPAERWQRLQRQASAQNRSGTAPTQTDVKPVQPLQEPPNRMPPAEKWWKRTYVQPVNEPTRKSSQPVRPAARPTVCVNGRKVQTRNQRQTRTTPQMCLGRSCPRALCSLKKRNPRQTVQTQRPVLSSVNAGQTSVRSKPTVGRRGRAARSAGGNAARSRAEQRPGAGRR